MLHKLDVAELDPNVHGWRCPFSVGNQAGHYVVGLGCPTI